MEEKKYPIYRIQIKWHQAIEEGKSYPEAWLKDVPDGYFSNSQCSNYVMLKEEDNSHIEGLIKDSIWSIKKKQKGHVINIDSEYSVELYETWCPGWFQHWTFDDGKSDEEFIRSFHDYVDRIKIYNQEYGTYLEDNVWCDAICLMGAEDSWRWSGDVGCPCRCEHCKIQGKVRIDH